jgi:hypothetical protein
MSMGDLTEGLELRCSQCRGIVETCAVCGAGLGVGVARCAMKDGAGHHHESCDAERKRRMLMRVERSSAEA